MKIPKKIHPDRIKDAIIEIRYTSKLPFEILLGIFFGALDDTYIYTGNLLGEQQFPAPFPGSDLTKGIKFSLGSQNLFHNDKIKIQLQPNSVIFNCLNEYILWENYKAEIERVLSQLHATNTINQYNRIGVRYISEYPDCDLQDCIKFSFTFGMPNIQSETYQFRSEFVWDGFRVILNLSNNIPIIKQGDGVNLPIAAHVSLIDIDVISDGFIETHLDNLMERLIQAQMKEKKSFSICLRKAI